jgi:hypothetical protein
MNAAPDLDERMAAYVDGDLDAAEREALESELGDEGLAEVAGLRKMLDLVRRRMRRRRRDDAGWLGGLVALPFQVLSIVIILAVATIFLMTELDRERATIERDPDAATPVEETPAAQPVADPGRSNNDAKNP